LRGLQAKAKEKKMEREWPIGKKGKTGQKKKKNKQRWGSNRRL